MILTKYLTTPTLSDIINKLLFPFGYAYLSMFKSTRLTNLLDCHIKRWLNFDLQLSTFIISLYHSLFVIYSVSFYQSLWQFLALSSLFLSFPFSFLRSSNVFLPISFFGLSHSFFSLDFSFPTSKVRLRATEASSSFFLSHSHFGYLRLDHSFIFLSLLFLAMSFISFSTKA